LVLVLVWIVRLHFLRQCALDTVDA
jgi:hypothetical protein